MDVDGACTDICTRMAASFTPLRRDIGASLIAANVEGKERDVKTKDVKGAGQLAITP